MSIVAGAASALTDIAHNVHTCLFRPLESVLVCYVGGLFRSDVLRASFSTQVKARLGSEVSAPAFSPAAGALLEALRLDQNRCELVHVPESER
jgi:sugar (pentulose or hexulose) kinase